MRYLLLMVLATALVYAGCSDGSSGGGDSGTTECSDGDTQCAGDMVQHCVDCCILSPDK